jgi:hypothetical protein
MFKRLLTQHLIQDIIGSQHDIETTSATFYTQSLVETTANSYFHLSHQYRKTAEQIKLQHTAEKYKPRRKLANRQSPRKLPVIILQTNKYHEFEKEEQFATLCKRSYHWITYPFVHSAVRPVAYFL